MKTKEHILRDSLDTQASQPNWEMVHSEQAILTLEVLLDIRDQLSALTTILGSVEKIAYRAG